jgi:hypothetical protein
MDSKRLVSEKTTTAYQQDFRNLFMALSNNPNHEEWKELYNNLPREPAEFYKFYTNIGNELDWIYHRNLN